MICGNKAFEKGLAVIAGTAMLAGCLFVEKKSSMENKEETGHAKTAQVNDGYPCSQYWEIPQVCGKNFWFMSRDGGRPVMPPNIDQFPRLKHLLENNVRVIYSFNSDTKIDANVPFFVIAPRWEEGTYCDLAGSIYGGEEGKVTSFRPSNTLNAAKGNNSNGWKSLEGLPQSIVYDFYCETPQIKKARVHPSFGNDRKTHFKVEVSLDGKSFETIGEYDGITKKEGNEFIINKKAVFVRITVLSDSLNQAHILKTEFFNETDKNIEPYVVSASSEAMPLNPKHVPTIAEQTCELKEKHGKYFLGYRIDETCNSLNRNILETFRSKRDPFYGKAEWVKNILGKKFPFRPMSPKDGMESYDNMVFALKTMAQCYGWKGGRTASDAIFQSSFHPFDHYYCEFGSAMSYKELTATNPERVRLEYMFSRSAARQYQRPWMVYTANSFYCVSDQIRKSLAEKEKQGIYKNGCKSLVFANTSASFSYRNLLIAYMMGCNIYENECAQWFGNWQLFAGNFNEKYKTDPYPGLSPIGKAHIKAGNFALSLKDRGIPYTPLAFSIDFKNGISFSFGPWAHGSDPEAWAEDGREYMMSVRTMETLMPWLPKDYKNHPSFGNMYETGNLRLSNSPFGDVFDLVIPNPPSGIFPQDMFDSYKVMILLGKINFTGELSKRYENYVKNGGTLLVNSMYLGKGIDETFAGMKLENAQTSISCQAFDQQEKPVDKLADNDMQKVVPVKLMEGCKVILHDENKNPLFVEYKQGKGRVITCLVPEMLSNGLRYEEEISSYSFHLAPKGRLMAGAEHLLKKLHDEALPFRIDGDIQFLLNKVSTGWLVTLVNNRGLYKEPDGPLVVDDDYTSVVRIYPKDGISIVDTEEILESGDGPIVKKSGNDVSSVIVSVPPGDVRVVKISTQPGS
jgi:hypothetical protein